MRRSSLFSRLKSTLLGTAVFAVFSFGFQSIALPIHASAHAAQHTFQLKVTSNSPHIVEANCDLCDLATHQAVQFSTVVHFEAIDAVALCLEPPRADTLILRLAHLPPVRGPPTRA